MLSIELFRDDLLSGKFHLDCPQMQLTQNTRNNPLVFRGPGYLSQDSPDNITVKMYPQKPPPITVFYQQKPPTVGRLIPKEKLYNLAAVDMNGYVWHSDRLSINESIYTPDYAVVIDASTKSLEAKQVVANAPNNLFYKIAVFGDIAIPQNYVSETVKKRFGRVTSRKTTFDSWMFQAKRHSFKISSDNFGLSLIVECLNRKYATKKLLMRSMEALRFVTGTQLEWNMLEKYRDGIITLDVNLYSSQANKRSFFAPLYIDQTRVNDITRLFDKYFLSIYPNKRNKWHPLTVLHNSWINAWNASLESFALALSVGVEGILNICYPDMSKKTPEYITKLDLLIKYIKKWKGDRDIRARALNTEKMWSHASSLSQLNRLAKKGIIEGKEVRAWHELRTKAAHSKIHDEYNQQRLFISCMEVLSMAYKMIFQAIGYEGVMREYGSLNWPDRIFKVK